MRWVAWLVVLAAVGSCADPDPFGEAERMLEARFGAWRGRVERASARLVELDASDRDTVALFAEAEKIAREEAVDGVAVVDWQDRARFWAGRTFDTDPETDFTGVREGIERVDILDLPAHRVLFAARPAGDGIAVAFLAFDERFPDPRNVAAEVARATGLASIELRFGSRTVPGAETGRVVDIDGLFEATLVLRSPPEIAAKNARARAILSNTLLFFGAVVGAIFLWRFARRRLPEGSLLGSLLAVAFVVGLRGLLSALSLPAGELWGGAGDTALTAFAALIGAIILARAAKRESPPRTTLGLALAGVVVCLFLPRIYSHLVGLLARRDDGVLLFDPLTVWPDLQASLLLAGLCFLTGAFFLVIHASYLWARRFGWMKYLPFLAVAILLLPWAGAWLALCSVLASLAILRGGTRVEKAVAVAFLAALASFPLVYTANRDVFVRDVAERARDLISRKQRREAEERLKDAVEATGDVSARVAQDLAVGHGVQHLAFRLWSAAEWDPDEPCAVQVWDTNGNLVSAFDFDSPPTKWLPAPPAELQAGTHLLFGRGKGVVVQFYARDFELRTIGDERLVGVARFVVPDQWHVLLFSRLRPSLFREPLDLRVHAYSRPVLLAELDPDGTPRRSSAGTTADLEPPPAALLRRARDQGYASARVRYRDRETRLVLGASRYSFAAVLFEENMLREGAFVFAKILLTYAAVCCLYMLTLLVRQRGRVHLLFRHRVALVLVLLSVPPVVLLAAHNKDVAEERHAEAVDERLRGRLDLAETLLRERSTPADDEWCTTLAANHLVDLNVYRGQELLATSRPGLWATGLVGRRLPARPYVVLEVENRDDYTGSEFFGHSASLRVAFRKVAVGWATEPVVLSAPALDDRRVIEREATESNALLLAIYLLSITVTIIVALFLARSLTRPVRQLREATSRIAAGELDAALPERRRDEFGDLIRAFNRMTRELQDAQDLRVRAEKARAWQEMARQVAHEIKNPLTPIKLTVQNLLAAYQEEPKNFAEEFEAGAKLILDQIAALHRIAGAFSAYAKFPRREPQPVDLHAIMADVAALYAAAGGSEVEVKPTSAPLVVRADYDELRRALLNLVTNARQAGARKVSLSAAPEDGYARLDVVDDGTGIPADVQARIFDPAFTTKTSGTGLGLPIVKRIVDDLGGAIEIESGEGKGTRITLRLPMV